MFRWIMGMSLAKYDFVEIYIDFYGEVNLSHTEGAVGVYYHVKVWN